MIGDDRAKLLRCLARHEVSYVIVGGCAALAYGIDHVTEDIDITPSRDRENLVRLASALEEMEARFRVERYPEGFVLPGRIDARGLEKMSAAAFITTHGNLDVVMWLEGLGDFTSLIGRAEELTLPGVDDLRVLVMDLGDLATAKRAAGRAKDIALLPLIDAAVRSRSPG